MVFLIKLSSLLSDYWETAGSQHGTCLCGDCPCQPSPHSRPHRQVRNLLRRTDLRSNSAFSFSPVSPSPSSRSLAELTSWGSPLKLSLPSFSSSGMLHHPIEINIMVCILTKLFTAKIHSFDQCGSCSGLCCPHRCDLCCDKREEQKGTRSSKCFQVLFYSAFLFNSNIGLSN